MTNPDTLRTAVSAAPVAPSLILSETDEALMRKTLIKCYGTRATGFRVSAEHYRYLVEQIIALREIRKRDEAS